MAEYLKQTIQQKCDSKTYKETEGDLQCFNDFNNLKDDYEAELYEWIYEQSSSKFTDEPSEIILLCRWETSDKQMVPFQASFHTDQNGENHWLLAYSIDMENLHVGFRCIIKNGICCMGEIFVNSFNKADYQGEVDILRKYLEIETIH